MGRRKVEMKRIEDKSSRQVTFSKRRSGLMKKARQLSILCDVQVAVVVFSSGGRLYEFCSDSATSISEMLERYQRKVAAKGDLSTDFLEKKNSKMASPSVQESTELVQTIRRCLESPNANKLSVDDFLQLKEQLYGALTHTRATKSYEFAYSSIQESAELVQTVQRCLESPNADELGVDDLMQLEEQLNAALFHTRATKTQLRLNSKIDLQQQEKLLREENKLLETKIAELQGSDDNDPDNMALEFYNLVDRGMMTSTQRETLPLLPQ